MARGKPKICPHCGFRHWPKYTPWEAAPVDVPNACERCKKDMRLKPQSDTETVYINGRMVERKK